MNCCKKILTYRVYLRYFRGKFLVLILLSLLLLILKSNIIFAMEEDEESPSRPIQNRASISLHATEKLQISSPSVAEDRENRRELDIYSNKLHIDNIKVEKLHNFNEKNLKLVFKNSSWILSLFNNSYGPIFSMFPRILNLSVTLDVSQKALSLEELKQAVDLTRKNTNIVGFVLNSLQPWNPCTQEGQIRNLLMSLAIRNSLMRGITTDLSYTFSSKSSLEEEAISEGLKNSNSIKEVDFLLNKERGKELIKNLRTNNGIEHIKLSLYGRTLSSDEINDLTYIIANSLSLKSLQLQVFPDDFLILSLANALKQDAISLENLALISTRATVKEKKINDRSMQTFFEAISVNKSLHVLQLGLPLSLKTYQDLSKSLGINQTLRALALPSNEINDNIVMSLSKGLKENTSLTTLDLSVNDISDKGADYILDILSINSTLESLYTWHTRISSLKRVEITQALHKQRARKMVEGKSVPST